MKIIHITAAYKPAYIYGGPTMSVSKLCEALIEAKNGVEVFTTTANGKSELEVKANKSKIVDGISVTYFKRLTKDHTHFSPALLWHLSKVLRQAQHDNIKLIIHIHAWWNLVSVLSCLIAKWYNVPVLLSPRGMLSTYSQHNRNSFTKKMLHRLIGKSLLKYCYIHATSEQEKSELMVTTQSKGSVVISNLLSSDFLTVNKHDKEYVKEKPENNSRFNIIFLSRIEQKKGLELLFHALSSIDIPWHLTIAGSGEQDYVKRLKQKAKDLMLDDRITWSGQISDSDKFRLIARHDLFALTSYNENFANVVIESLSVGTPVLISNEVGLAGYVVDKDFGWVCRLTTEDIKAKILLAFNDSEKRTRIGLNAPHLIKQDFSDKVLIEKYLQLYTEVVMKGYES